MNLSVRTSLLTLFSFILIITGCNGPSSQDTNMAYVCPMHCEGDKTYNKPGTCPVCKMDLVDTSTIEKTIVADPETIEELSIFNLTSKWKTQNNKDFGWIDMRGEPFVMTMIYTTCKAACPRLVADMKNIEAKVNSTNVRYVLVSIDPEIDTPERLAAFAEDNQLDDKWILLNGSLEDVRELSNVVAVKYMKISPLDFSHSNIITLFNAEGVLDYQQEGLGVDNKDLVTKTRELAQ